MKNPTLLHPRARCYKVSRSFPGLGYRLLTSPGAQFCTIGLLSIMYSIDYQSVTSLFNIILII